jgi:TDG/mug DNA glycosylase family protein
MSVLPDVLRTGLKVIFCGTAAGPKSARVGAYYAGRGNAFWDVLNRVGLTPLALRPEEFRSLSAHGFGLTDLAKNASGTDDRLTSRDLDADAFLTKIAELAPLAIAFNGKKAAKTFYRRAVNYGVQPKTIRGIAVFVLPSTSAAARRYWNETYWRELARFLEG